MIYRSKYPTYVLNLIIPKYSTKYHSSSTMVNGSVYAQKIDNQNRKQPVVTNRTLNARSTTFNKHDKVNEELMWVVKKQ